MDGVLTGFDKEPPNSTLGQLCQLPSAQMGPRGRPSLAHKGVTHLSELERMSARA